MLLDLFFLTRLRCQAFEIGAETAQFGIATQGRDLLVRRSTTEDHTFGRDKLARHGNDGQIRQLTLHSQGRLQVLNDQDVAKQVIDQCLNPRTDPHLVHSPKKTAFRQELAIHCRTQCAEVLRHKSSLAHLFVCKTIQDLTCKFGIRQKHRLEMVAQCSLDRWNVFLIHFDSRGQKTAHSRGINLRVIHAFEDVLSALCESLPVFHHLLQHFKSAVALGALTLRLREFLRGNIELTLLLHDLVSAMFEALIKVRAGLLKLLNLAMQIIKLNLTGLPSLGSHLPIMLERLITLAIPSNLRGEALHFCIGARHLALAHADCLTHIATVPLQAGSLGDDELMLGAVLVHRHLPLFDIAA